MVISNVQSVLVPVEVTIAESGSLSAAVDIKGATIVGVIMPAAWTAANLTLQASIDDETYNNVYDKFGTEVNIPVAASRHVIVSPAELTSLRYVKLRSGTSGTPVTQAAARVITLVVRPV